MEVMAVTVVILAVIVLGLLFSRTWAERRLRLVQSQIALEKLRFKHQVEQTEDAPVVRIVDTVRSEAALDRIEFWTRAGWMSLWKGLKLK